MAIHLDHMIVPVRDKHAAAKRLAALLDVPSAESLGEFVAVFVNEGLTLDFAEREALGGTTSASASRTPSSTRSSGASRPPASRTAAVLAARTTCASTPGSAARTSTGRTRTATCGRS